MANCPLCATASTTVLATKLRRGVGTVYHCLPCDLGFLVAPAVDPKEYYARDYRQQASHKATGDPTNAQEIFAAYSPYQEPRLKLVLDNAKSRGSILEIGASAGQFLRHMDGIFVRRCAIELDPDCVEYMKRQDIEAECESVENSSFFGQQFDVVVVFQVLEHIADPVVFLRAVRGLLKPDGVAIIEVPNLHDGLRDIAAYNQFYFHSDHLMYFSKKSLAAVAERAGFSVSKVRFMQSYNVINAISWATTGKPQSDCHIGLGPSHIKNATPGIQMFLSLELMALNREYVSSLVTAGQTDNIAIVLTSPEKEPILQQSQGV